MRRVETIMGTAISIDAPRAGNATLERAFERLRQIDQRFSTYLETSEVSQMRRSELTLAAASPEVKYVHQECAEWQQRTGGYFSAYYDRQFDPSGYVKGWAIAEAATVLKKEGLDDYMINAGGDILAAAPAEQHRWRIGIENPLDPSQLVGVITAGNIAVATSGTYRRGEHIVDPVRHKPATGFAGLTVIGRDITTADVLATTICAMGITGAEYIDREWPGYAAMGILPDGQAIVTSRFGQLASLAAAR